MGSGCSTWPGPDQDRAAGCGTMSSTTGRGNGTTLPAVDYLHAEDRAAEGAVTEA